MTDNTIQSRNWLRTFLNYVWLRPENALWRSLNCQSLEGLTFEEPSLDLSCGDGLFSFLLAGGDFDITFDKFEGTADLDKYYENEDIYNAAPDEYDPEISQRPDYTMTVGTDWKPLQLEKARELDFYDELIEHDNNERLPFEDDRFKTVFTNSAYWVENLDFHLSEINRVLHPDGKAIFVLKTPESHNLMDTVESHRELLGENLVEIIDRGRKNNKRHLYHDEGWSNRLNKAELDIQDRQPTVSSWHAAMWDIGLRPIAPQLIKMAQTLPQEARNEIKFEWLDVWEELLAPFDEPSFDLNRDRRPAEIIYLTSPS